MKKYGEVYSLDEIEKLLNPDEFLRINRNFIVSCKAVSRFEPFCNNWLFLHMILPTHVMCL